MTLFMCSYFDFLRNCIHLCMFQSVLTKPMNKAGHRLQCTEAPCIQALVYFVYAYIETRKDAPGRMDGV